MGSSRSRTSLPANRMRASSTRRRSPPESTASGRSTRSPIDPEAGDERAHLRLRRVAAVGSERLLGAGEAGDVRVAGVLLHREAQLLDAHGRLIEAATRQHVGQCGHAVEQAGDPRVLREVAERALAVDDA